MTSSSADGAETMRDAGFAGAGPGRGPNWRFGSSTRGNFLAGEVGRGDVAGTAIPGGGLIGRVMLGLNQPLLLIPANVVVGVIGLG